MPNVLEHISISHEKVLSQDLVMSRNPKIGSLNCRIYFKFDRRVGSRTDEAYQNLERPDDPLI